MRITHFESLRPVCPVCRNRESGHESALKISSVACETKSQIVDGVLQCTNIACQSEFPVVDGVPILLRNLRAYVSENIFHIYARHDLSDICESILGDCCSQGSVLDSMRQHLSSYVWDHYGDLDPLESPSQLEPLSRPGSVIRMLNEGLELETISADAAAVVNGPSLDIGCGPGRTSIAVSNFSNQFCLGIDLNFSMLRLASNMLRSGRICYPKRRSGVVYDRRDFAVELPQNALVDYWACDALDLPFSDGLFHRVTSMNVLDSVASPTGLLASIVSCLKPNGSLVLACPYDWSVAVTPIESWIGGHSQRGHGAGSCSHGLRQLLESFAAMAGPSGGWLQLVSERENVPWTVRIHERSQMQYHSHLVHARHVRGGDLAQ